MKTCCMVVIGHVDHGKTALVRALTGTETDRLPEEKARGLSITPGFAHCSYPGGTIDIVDAPGHADFVQAMVAGATGAQAALVVISMKDGVEAQTLEHLRIAELLGIKRGVIAVSKADVLDASEQDTALAGIRAALSMTAFADAPVVACSATSGDGIDTLQAVLQDMLVSAALLPQPLASFLPIDRVFTLPGRGTIVTGTLLGDTLSVGDPVVLHPEGCDVTIRGLQARGAERDRIQVGERMAANLRGVAVDGIERGAVLCATGISAPSLCADMHLDPLSAQAKTLRHMQEVRVLFGTSSEVAQVRRFKGADRFAQLRFKKPIVGFAGQHAILRRLSPVETIGGAVFLDPQAQPTRSSDLDRPHILESAHRGDLKDIATVLAANGGGVAKRSDIARLSRQSLSDLNAQLATGFTALDADLISANHDIADAKLRVLHTLATYHEHHPLHAMAPLETIEAAERSTVLLHHIKDALLAEGQIIQSANMLALSGHDPLALLSDAQRGTMNTLEDAIVSGGLTPPAVGTLTGDAQAAELLQLLIDTGRLISLRNVALRQTLLLHVNTVTLSAHTLSAAFPAPVFFTTSEARAVLSTSRRIIVPLLEHFDSLGVTLRTSDTRQMATPNSVSPNDHPR